MFSTRPLVLCDVNAPSVSLLGALASGGVNPILLSEIGAYTQGLPGADGQSHFTPTHISPSSLVAMARRFGSKLGSLFRSERVNSLMAALELTRIAEYAYAHHFDVDMPMGGSSRNPAELLYEAAQLVWGLNDSTSILVAGFLAERAGDMARTQFHGSAYYALARERYACAGNQGIDDLVDGLQRRVALKAAHSAMLEHKYKMAAEIYMSLNRYADAAEAYRLLALKLERPDSGNGEADESEEEELPGGRMRATSSRQEAARLARMLQAGAYLEGGMLSDAAGVYAKMEMYGNARDLWRRAAGDYAERGEYRLAGEAYIMEGDCATKVGHVRMKAITAFAEAVEMFRLAEMMGGQGQEIDWGKNRSAMGLTISLLNVGLAHAGSRVAEIMGMKDVIFMPGAGIWARFEKKVVASPHAAAGFRAAAEAYEASGAHYQEAAEARFAEAKALMCAGLYDEAVEVFQMVRRFLGTQASALDSDALEWMTAAPRVAAYVAALGKIQESGDEGTRLARLGEAQDALSTEANADFAGMSPYLAIAEGDLLMASWSAMRGRGEPDLRGLGMKIKAIYERAEELCAAWGLTSLKKTVHARWEVIRREYGEGEDL